MVSRQRSRTASSRKEVGPKWRVCWLPRGSFGEGIKSSENFSWRHQHLLFHFLSCPRHFRRSLACGIAMKQASLVGSWLLFLFVFCTAEATTAAAATLSSSNVAAASFRFSKANEGSSPFIDMRYHNGPVLTPDIRVYLIWYGQWRTSQQSIIRDFLHSISADAPAPSVKSWWSTVQLYTDQTGANISDSLGIAGEHDAKFSHGKSLTRMTIQEVIKSALKPYNGTLPVDPRGGVYMVLTSEDVVQQDFCSAACGFHYFTYSSIVGYTLPYAWVGNSGRQCPDTCAYPFAIPFYMANAVKAVKPPNGDVGVDGMVSVIGHELAEMSSNPLINAWFAGSDPEAPTEIADLCEGMYGSGAGGGYAGALSVDRRSGASYNVLGARGRKFLVQWLWNPVIRACHGPNALPEKPSKPRRAPAPKRHVREP